MAYFNSKISSFFAPQSKQSVTSDEKLDDAQEGQMRSDTSSESDDQVSLPIPSSR